MSSSNNPETWSRFIEEKSPGLTWLASTLLEWAELPPGARRAWTVTAQSSRGGDIESLAAIHEESGMLAVASKPGVPAPFLGTHDRVRRVVGAPETVESLLDQAPVLRLRRGAGVQRAVFVCDGDPPRRHPALARAPNDTWEALESLRTAAGGNLEPFTSPDLAGPIQCGLVWELRREKAPVGFFRIEGIGHRRIQVTDVCVHPDHRGGGLGTALVQSAAHVARSEYVRGCVLAVAADEVAQRTARGAGFTEVGVLEDVHFD